MLKFVLLVNKQGQTRLSQYYEYVPVEERVTTEADIVRKCLARSEDAVSKLDYYSWHQLLSLVWPDPTRRKGSGPMPNVHLYQHPTDNWGCDKWLWL